MSMDIAPEKVAHVIIKAREYDAKVGAWNDTPEEGDAEEDPSAILEDFTNDPTRRSCRFIGLNYDEQKPREPVLVGAAHAREESPRRWRPRSERVIPRRAI
jgi:hypothetical protein